MSAHVDTFARDNLPARELWPEFLFEGPDLQFPEQLNCATELLDRRVAMGEGDRLCIQGTGIRWTYAELLAEANRIARVLVDDLGLVPGNRVLLRGANSPKLAACWFAVVKAGGIAVGSMPLLRAKELTQIVAKAEITHALCDARLAEELALARPACPTLVHVLHFNDASPGELDARAAAKPATFDNVATAADDTCLIAFTSGTTGQPKGTMHFHRDVMAACACWPKHVLRPTAGRRLHRQPTARLHLRPRRHAAVSDVGRRVDGAAREGLAGRPARGNRAVPRHGVLHRADVLPCDGGAARRPRPAVAAPVRQRRGSLAGGDAPAVEGRERHRDDRRHRLDRDAAHLHLARRGACEAGRDRHRRARLPRPA